MPGDTTVEQLTHRTRRSDRPSHRQFVKIGPSSPLPRSQTALFSTLRDSEDPMSRLLDELLAQHAIAPRNGGRRSAVARIGVVQHVSIDILQLTGKEGTMTVLSTADEGKFLMDVRRSESSPGSTPRNRSPTSNPTRASARRCSRGSDSARSTRTTSRSPQRASRPSPTRRCVLAPTCN